MLDQTPTSQVDPPPGPSTWGTASRRRRTVLLYLQRNPSLLIGMLLLLLLALIATVGRFVVDISTADPLSAPSGRPPSWDYPLGTDKQGRNLVAVLVVGTWLTCKVGLVAGLLGVITGTMLGFIGGYFHGWVDAIISLVIDVFLAVPPLLILIVISANIKTAMTTNEMALIIASLAWREPARRIRAQVLIMREMSYVNTARLNGTGSLGIIFKEMMPNLIPYLMASLVLATSAAMLSSVGLEALGLGPQNEPTLGMTIYWAMFYSALLQGYWWWMMTPILVLIVLFLGLYLVTVGLDELANPRLKRSGGV